MLKWNTNNLIPFIAGEESGLFPQNIFTGYHAARFLNIVLARMFHPVTVKINNGTLRRQRFMTGKYNFRKRAEKNRENITANLLKMLITCLSCFSAIFLRELNMHGANLVVEVGTPDLNNCPVIDLAGKTKRFPLKANFSLYKN